MNITVIGRTGQVATALVERAGTHTVTALGRPDVDLADPASLAEALERTRPDAVVNAAAYTAVDAAESDEAAARVLNADGPSALAQLCAEAAVPLVHLSTDYVFDGTLDRPYREDDATGPQSAYGRTKLAGEEAVRAAGGRAITARTAWVYAPFGKNFVRTMLRLGAERDHLRVVADQHGNPTSALDIADAILALCAASDGWPQTPDTVHLAGTGEATWHSFAETIFSFTTAPADRGADHDGAVSDPGAAPGQLAARLRQAGGSIRPHPAALARQHSGDRRAASRVSDWQPPHKEKDRGAVLWSWSKVNAMPRRGTTEHNTPVSSSFSEWFPGRPEFYARPGPTRTRRSRNTGSLREQAR